MYDVFNDSIGKHKTLLNNVFACLALFVTCGCQSRSTIYVVPTVKVGTSRWNSPPRLSTLDLHLASQLIDQAATKYNFQKAVDPAAGSKYRDASVKQIAFYRKADNFFAQPPQSASILFVFTFKESRLVIVLAQGSLSETEDARLFREELTKLLESRFGKLRVLVSPNEPLVGGG